MTHTEIRIWNYLNKNISLTFLAKQEIVILVVVVVLLYCQYWYKGFLLIMNSYWNTYNCSTLLLSDMNTWKTKIKRDTSFLFRIVYSTRIVTRYHTIARRKLTTALNYSQKFACLKTNLKPIRFHPYSWHRKEN